MRRILLCWGLLLLTLLYGRPAAADAWHQCVQGKITGGDPVRMDVSHYSVPWTAWIGAFTGTLGPITVSGYGPCRTNDPPLTCPRVGATQLGTLDVSDVQMIRGVGPLEAVEFAAGTCTGEGCIGGANAGEDCSVASECPGGRCGCEVFVAFCGSSPGIGN